MLNQAGERPSVDVRSGKWTAIGATEVGCLRELAAGHVPR
jgi:hypothetical protein